MHFTFFSLEITIITAAIFLFGCYFLFKIISEIDKKFKSSILFLLFAFISNMIVSILHSGFFMNLDPENPLLLGIPLLHLATAALLLIGVRRFFVALESSK